jgi:hypothetical protein
MTGPALSIVLVTPDAGRLAKILRCYRATGDPDRLEIVIVAVAGTVVPRESIAALGFRHVQTIAVAGTDIGRAEELAVLAASATYVVLGQLHCYPMPGFVDAILSALQIQPWTVVGPAMTNANPGSVISRAAMLIHYGAWSPRRPSGVAVSVPAHNSAYRRPDLLALGSTLYEYLDADASLQDALRASGGTLFFEPAAQIDVVNISKFRAFLRDQFLQGTDFAYRRRRHWPLIRRFLYVLGSPLIPAVRLARIGAGLYTDRRLNELLRVLPILLVGLFANAAGEVCGYAASVRCQDSRTAAALDRLRYIAEADRRHEMDESTWPAASMNSRGSA